MNRTLPPPGLAHLCDLAVDVGTPVDAGVSPFGRRRFVPITGGTATGKLSGRVVPGGADFQLVTAGRIARLEASYMLELDDGAHVFVRNLALRVAGAEVTASLLRGEPVAAGQVYFRGQVTLETGDSGLAWLNERLFVCVGERDPQTVRMSFYELA